MAPATLQRHSSASLTKQIPELRIFLDFIDDDDRPTFVLEQSTLPRIVFRNAALDALVAETSHDSLFLNWVDTLSNIAGDSSSQHVSRTEVLGTFAARVWSSKRIGGAWTAVFCRQGHDPGQQVDASLGTQLSGPQDTHELEELDIQDADKVPVVALADPPVESHEVDPWSSSDSCTLDSFSTLESTAGIGSTSGSLGDLKVDWLSFPHLTSDPWIKLLVEHEWETTAVGALRDWDPILRQTYATILSSTEPRVLYWGEELYMFYNAAARFLVGEMHPYPLGNPLANVWGAPMREELTEILKRGIRKGTAVRNKRRELVITRNGFPESAFFDFVFLPIPSAEGRFMGFVNEFTEITETVVQENRFEVSTSLLQNVSKASSMEDLWTRFVTTLEEKSNDVSYAMIYAMPSAISSANDLASLRLQAAFGIDTQDSSVSPAIAAALQRSRNNVVVLEQRKMKLPPELAVNVPGVGVVNTAFLLPIVGLDGHQVTAVLVLGSSPMRPLNPSGRQFAESVRDLFFKSTTLLSLPMEQRKAQEITAALSQQLGVATTKAEKSEQNFTRMVRDAPMGMCIHASDGYPLYVNDAYLRLLGVSRAEFYTATETGFAWRDAIYEDDLEKVDMVWATAMETRMSDKVEFRVKSPSSASGYRWLEAAIEIRQDDDGNIVTLYGWLTDVSSRKLTDSLVEERLADALENKRSSENFIDMVSHEMRNPLSSILQLADNVLLSLPSATEEGSCILTPGARLSLVDSAQTITLCAKHQKNIIDEVLTFSKLDSKLLVLALDRVQPPTIVESVLRMVKAELEHADIQASLKIKQSYHDLAVNYVFADPGRLSQVLINLVTNAVKFTQSSSTRHITISIAASQLKPTSGDCSVTFIEPRDKKRDDAQVRSVATYNGPVGEEIFLCFSVEDTGCGLTRAEMEHLFHRFTQASPKTYKQYGGSGLGLFISRELIELQGGQVGVHSESGKGSTFAFYIKSARLDPPPEAIQRASQPVDISATPILNHAETTETSTICKITMQDLHVLVVEDNAINQRVMAQQLRRMGCAMVHVADHGLDGLELLRTTTFLGPAATGKIPLSVVLLDVEMPIMDGLTCARQIRELQKTGEISRHVPIIGITANARPDQIIACIKAGMDEVVTKPFRMPQLVPRMMALVDKHNAQGQVEVVLPPQQPIGIPIRL
ncbi:hypothetical protein AAFC00_003807 [Neodothiora populina]